MLEKPALDDAKIIECLHDDYGLKIAEVTFLPLGADVNTAVYRAVSTDAVPYFVKLRREVFDELSVLLPKLLHDQGITQIIEPVSTRSGALWVTLDSFNLTLYPFIEGRNGFEVDLSDAQWVEFGRALKGVHTAVIPPGLAARLQREAYSPKWRETVKRYQQQIETTTFNDPVASKLAAFLRGKGREISHLIKRAEALGAVLQAQSLQFVVCHSDIHAGNLLITEDGFLYLVDWDAPILAPKERDLMFIGGGVVTRSTPEQEAWFYEGYGQADINPIALAYYRYERIVQDIAAYCGQILFSDEGGEDRQAGVRQLMGQWSPYDVIAMAYHADKTLPPDLQSAYV